MSRARAPTAGPQRRRQPDGVQGRPPDDVPATVVLTGAGISTESGIPDFRSKGGVWDRFDPMEFTIDRFHQDPARFWERRGALITAMGYLDAAPNAAHVLLANAARDGAVAAIVTQNVDGLHMKAGTPADRLIEVHGNGAWCRCQDCGRQEATIEVLARRAPGSAPRCACRGLLKPDVVLFGEEVPRLPDAAAAVAMSDRLVVVGSSLQVWPVAGLAAQAVRQGAEMHIVCRSPTPFDVHATLHRGPIAPALARILDV